MSDSTSTLIEVPTKNKSRILALAARDGGMRCHYCHRPLSLLYKRCVAIEYHADFWYTPEDGDQHPGYYPVYETCLLDGCESIEMDHKVPRVFGGSNKPDNLVLCCRRCNSTKRHRYSYEQFMAITEGFRR